MHSSRAWPFPEQNTGLSHNPSIEKGRAGQEQSPDKPREREKTERALLAYVCKSVPRLSRREENTAAGQTGTDGGHNRAPPSPAPPREMLGLCRRVAFTATAGIF